MATPARHFYVETCTHVSNIIIYGQHVGVRALPIHVEQLQGIAHLDEGPALHYCACTHTRTHTPDKQVSSACTGSGCTKALLSPTRWSPVTTTPTLDVATRRRRGGQEQSQAKAPSKGSRLGSRCDWSRIKGCNTSSRTVARVRDISIWTWETFEGKFEKRPPRVEYRDPHCH